MTEQPDGLGYLVLVESTTGLDELYLLNTLTGTPQRLLELEDAVAMALGRNRSLYIILADGAGGSRVQRIALDPEPVVVASVGEPAVQAITTDDAGVVLLSTTTKTLRRMDFALSEDTDVVEIDALVDLGGNPHVAVSPTDDMVWILTDAADYLFGLSPDGDLVEMVDISNPTGFDFGDNGHLFVSSNGVVVELARTAPGIWEVVEDSPLAGLESEGLLHITRSRTNYTPGDDQTAGPFNIDPEEVLAGVMVPREPLIVPFSKLHVARTPRSRAGAVLGLRYR